MRRLGFLTLFLLGIGITAVAQVTTTSITTLSSAISAGCATPGGTVLVPPNYTETLAANITIPSNCTIQFQGPATIQMGAHQITFSQANNVAVTGPYPGGFFGTTNGVVFHYTGNSYPFLLGNGTTSSNDLLLANFGCDVHDAGSTALGCFDLIQVNRFKLENLGGFGSGGTHGQIFLLLDGSGSFTGDSNIVNPWSGSFGTCIKFTSTSGANNNVILGGTCPGSSGTGLDFEGASNGNTVLGYDVEGATTGVMMGGTNFGNRVSIYGQGNGTDFTLGANTSSNVVDNVGVGNAACAGALPSVSDSGTNNDVVNPCQFARAATGQVAIGEPIQTGVGLFLGAQLGLTGSNQKGMWIEPSLKGTAENDGVVSEPNIGAVTAALDIGVRSVTPVISGGAIVEWNGIRVDPAPTVTGTACSQKLFGSTSGSVCVNPAAVSGTANFTYPAGTSSGVLTSSLTTTAATTDNVTVTGMTALGHCSLTATNTSGAANTATTFVSAKAANQITVTHTATAGLKYDVICSPI